MIAEAYKSEKPVNITENGKNHLKRDCVNGSTVNGTREANLHSFALSSPPVENFFKEPRKKLFKKVLKSILPHTTFYLEDDDHKLVDFNIETISFTFLKFFKSKHSYLQL